MGLCAVILAQRGSTSPARTYGWHRAEVFIAVANAVLLIGVATLILREAIGRIGQAPEVPGIPMVVVALIGLATDVAGRAAAAIAVDAEPGRQGRLHGGGRRHGRQHRCADRRSGYHHHRLALRRRGGRRLVALWVLPRALSLAAGALRILSESSPSHINVDDLARHWRRSTASPRCTICTSGRWCPARTW